MSDGNTTTNTNQQNQTVNGPQINADRATVGHIGDVIHQAPKKPITFPLHYIALSKNPHFTGRADELERIHAAVGDGGVGVITQTIAGLGGVGKTQLVAEYAHLHVQEYDLIYWLPANDELTLMEAMATLAYRLQVAKLEDAQPQAAARAAIHWLENSRQRWLLLVDNADLPQMTPAIVESYLPKTGNGAVLISSRNSDWGGWKTLKLDVFSDDEAVAFMTARLGATATADKQSAIALARELGGLALALEHAVAYVDRHAKTIADYLRLFRARQKALWDKAKPPRDYQEKTITTTWTISFEALAASGGSATHLRGATHSHLSDAAALLNLCAFFAPDGIPMALLAEHAATLPPPLDGCAADELRLDAAIAAAKAHSLLTTPAGAANGSVNMHRLVQLVAQQRLADRERWLNAAVTVLRDAWPFDHHDMSTWDACPPLLPHLIAVADYADQYDLQTGRVAYLNSAAGYYLKVFGSYQNAHRFYKRNLAIREKLLADDPDNGDLLADTATSLNNLGVLLKEMGEYGEARPLYERALVIDEKQLGSDHPNIATLNNNLGGLLQAMGEYEEARPLYERALVIDEKQLGSDHPNVATANNNLGGLLKTMGEYGEARPFYERALAITEKQLGSDHPTTAIRLNNLGGLLQAMGEYEKARPFYERALAIREAQLGSDHPEVATSYNNMAWLAHNEGNKQEAVRLMRWALAIFEKSLGNAHPNTQTARQSLAAIEAA